MALVCGPVHPLECGLNQGQSQTDVCFRCLCACAYVHIRNLKPGQCVPFLKHASAAVYDIPSISTHGMMLGSVCYSDSFIDSSLTVSDPGLHTYTFAAAGPGLWNSLLPHLRDADLLYSQFRQSLKTILFG